MRTRLFLLALPVTSMAVAASIQACSDASTDSPSDAGADVVDSGRRTLPPEDAATCDTSADFTKLIPDAAIADGASTTGICMACTEANCKSYVQQCNQSCECQELAARALECYAKSGDAFACLAANASATVSKETQATGIGLFSCVSSSCKTECQTDRLDGGSATDASDAADGADAG